LVQDTRSSRYWRMGRAKPYIRKLADLLPSKEKTKSVEDRTTSTLLQERFINHLMRHGKKNTARKIYGNLAKYCWQKDQVDVKDLLVEAIEKASPLVILKSKRQGARRIRVPFPLRKEQQESIGIRWILEEARKGKEKKAFLWKLYTLLTDTAQKKGPIISRRNQLMEEAKANRGNERQRWS